MRKIEVVNQIYDELDGQLSRKQISRELVKANFVREQAMEELTRIVDKKEQQQNQIKRSPTADPEKMSTSLDTPGSLEKTSDKKEK